MTRRLYLIAVRPAKTYNRRMHSDDAFSLKAMTSGEGRVSGSSGSAIKLELGEQPEGYGLAQLDDYHHLTRSEFRWHPPLHMKLQARTSIAEPTGTLGFGFWNDPFTLSIGQAGTARRLPASPQAAWFFYGSPPNDLPLAPPLPGHGWKAAVLRAPRIPALLLAPGTLATILAAQIPGLRQVVMKAAIRAVKAEETILEAALDQNHTYELHWEERSVRFSVDHREVLSSAVTPQAPLGFVAWIDNQYAVASPSGGFRFGVIPTSQQQALELIDLSITTSHRRPASIGMLD